MNDLYLLRREAFPSADACAQHYQISAKTLRRWEHAADPSPLAMDAFLYRAGYLLDWPGFHVRGSDLYLPSGESLGMNQIEGYYYMLQLHRGCVHGLERKIAELESRVPQRALCAWLQSEPLTPPAWPLAVVRGIPPRHSPTASRGMNKT